MASTKRSWLWVVLGLMGMLALIVVVVAGTAIYQFRQHVKSEYVESGVATQEFDRVRERFRGQQPLIEFSAGQGDHDGRPAVHRPPATAPRVRINAVRVLIYDRNQGHLIHADIPGWMIPYNVEAGALHSPGGIFGEFDTRDSQITRDDLERHGLGLVMDGRNQKSRILIWTE